MSQQNINVSENEIQSVLRAKLGTSYTVCDGMLQQGRPHLQAKGSSLAIQAHEGLPPVVQLLCCSPARAEVVT